VALSRLCLTLILLVGAAACAPSESDQLPRVAILLPPDGSRYPVGQTIQFTIAAVARRGVARVELMQGDQIVATQVNPTRSATFSTRLGYAPPREGRLTFSAVAVDADGRLSSRFSISLLIGQDQVADALPPLITTPVVRSDGCVLGAAFVADVTIPDGTAIKAGTTFTKTWRMRNTSGCDWGEGYTIAFFSDTPMHPTGSEPVRPTPSNAIVEISVPLTAPSQPGVYTTTWRLKDPAGRFFGHRVFAVIRVP
jgi:hypothetical protein